MVQWIYGASCFVRRNPSPSASSVNTRGPFYSAGYRQPRPQTQPTTAAHHQGNKGQGTGLAVTFDTDGRNKASKQARLLLP